MKNSVQVLPYSWALILAAVLLSGYGCRRSDKTADVAQDSILVRDADTAQKRTGPGDTLPTLVKQGRTVTTPSLTNGAPPLPPGITPATPVRTNPRMPPPRRPTPPLILRGRESTTTVDSGPSPPKPKTDTGRDTLSGS